MPLIKAYGEFWFREAIEWGAKGPGGQGKLLGHMGKKVKPFVVDAWEQEAVYMLHAEYAVIYVGVASGTKLGSRLRGHRDDHLAGRWDQFSWYGALPFNTPSQPIPNSPAIAPGPIGPAGPAGALAAALREVEALMIRAAPSALNKKTEGLPAAELVRQARASPLTLETALASLTKQNEGLAKRLTAVEKKLP